MEREMMEGRDGISKNSGISEILAYIETCRSLLVYAPGILRIAIMSGSSRIFE